MAIVLFDTTYWIKKLVDAGYLVEYDKDPIVRDLLTSMIQADKGVTFTADGKPIVREPNYDDV